MVKENDKFKTDEEIAEEEKKEEKPKEKKKLKPLEEAQEINDQKEKLLKKEEEILDRREKLLAEEKVGGRAEAGAGEPVKETEDEKWAREAKIRYEGTGMDPTPTKNET